MYLYATVAIYGGSIAVRTLCTAWFNLGTSKATVSWLVDNAVNVRVKVPTTKGRWRAGQHVFIRFLSLRLYQTHPFSIASIEEDGDLVLIIKQRTGLTGALYDKVKAQKGSWETRVLIDGPYGGPSRDPGSFDTVLCVAGGVGITFTFPIMKDIVHRMQGLGKLRCSKLIFVWVVRSENTLDWLKEEISRGASAAEDWVQVEYYITDKKLASGEKDWIDSNITVDYGRPNLGNVLSAAAEQNHGRMCVLGAGPEGLMNTLCREVANLQKLAIKTAGSEEIFMHVETFGW